MWSLTAAKTFARKCIMEKIELKHTLPNVFAGRENTASDIWLQDIALLKGKRYLIAAESGTGKSSLCAFIYGYRNDYSGTIAFDQRDVRTMSIDDWCRVRCEHIAYMPQEMRLFPELTALENVELKNRITQHKTRQEIEGLFEVLGIADKMQSTVARLSIGQQQRVAVIRTLCQTADFFLLDEPVSHLDETNNRTVARLVTDEAAKQGAGIIATSVGNHLQLDVDQTFNL